MKSHEKIYAERIAALKKHPLIPDDPAEFKKLTDPKGKAKVWNSDAHDADGLQIFPEPKNGKYPAAFVAFLENAWHKPIEYWQRGLGDLRYDKDNMAASLLAQDDFCGAVRWGLLSDSAKDSFDALCEMWKFCSEYLEFYPDIDDGDFARWRSWLDGESSGTECAESLKSFIDYAYMFSMVFIPNAEAEMLDETEQDLISDGMFDNLLNRCTLRKWEEEFADVEKSDRLLTVKIELFSMIVKAVQGFPESESLVCQFTERIKQLCADNHLPVPGARLEQLCSERNAPEYVLREEMGEDYYKVAKETLDKNDHYERERHKMQLMLAESETRRKVLFEMSHSIKNLVASVTDPLARLRGELTSDDQKMDIDNALAGASLIRELALQVHMSMRGTPGAWRSDFNAPGSGASPLGEVLEKALRYAVGNMFNGKYFGRFTQNYFTGSLDRYLAAKDAVNAAHGINELVSALKTHFFDCSLEIPEALLNHPVGDREGTATKLLILFQEILLNAVKYASFTSREGRQLTIKMSQGEEWFTFEAVNSADGSDAAKNPSGIGHIVIQNFATMFEAESAAGACDGEYRVYLKFNLQQK